MPRDRVLFHIFYCNFGGLKNIVRLYSGEFVISGFHCITPDCGETPKRGGGGGGGVLRLKVRWMCEGFLSVCNSRFRDFWI